MALHVLRVLETAVRPCGHGYILGGSCEGWVKGTCCRGLCVGLGMKVGDRTGSVDSSSRSTDRSTAL